MISKKTIVIILTIVLSLYCFLGFLVFMRQNTYAPPMQANQNYLRAIKSRDLQSMYAYSDRLKAHLEGMLQSSNLTEPKRKELLAEDYSRWSKAVLSDQPADDNLWAERRLIGKGVVIEPVLPEDYRAEILLDGDLYLTSYRNEEGKIHHSYFRLTYPSPNLAAKVKLFNNIGNPGGGRIKSVIVRLEARIRTTVGGWNAFLLRQGWLAGLSVAYPFLSAETRREPSDVWMCALSFDVDKKTLSTF